MQKKFRALFVLGATLFFVPAIASAHAFGQQYTLPLPFQFYAFGAVCALVASFVFLGLYSKPDPSRANIVAIRQTFAIRRWTYIEIFLRTLGILGFIATILCAFVGPQDFTLNPAPELFWTVLLLGFTYLSVFIGDLWRFVSPFETFARILLVKKSEPVLHYPLWLGYFPALAFYFALIWFELLSGGAGAVPAIVGEVLIGYSVVSGIGAGIFGVEEWFTHADFFTVFFGLIGLFAPIKIERNLISLQAPAERLVLEQTGRMSLLLFILFMLASTAFDGLEETQIWWNTLYSSLIQIQLYPLERDVIFLASPFIFLALYGCAIYLMRIFTRTRLQYTTLLLRFAYSLIPIAIAYNFAHYFTLLVNGIQALFAMASDPLAKGWNIFGTAHYQVNIGLIGAKQVWYAQFSAILLGHIIATYVAHRIALREFPTRGQVLFGQLPMLLLMVFYTVFGLWILSQGYQNGI
jgi:hypothetical protein